MGSGPAWRPHLLLRTLRSMAAPCAVDSPGLRPPRRCLWPYCNLSQDCLGQEGGVPGLVVLSLRMWWKVAARGLSHPGRHPVQGWPRVHTCLPAHLAELGGNSRGTVGCAEGPAGFGSSTERGAGPEARRARAAPVWGPPPQTSAPAPLPCAASVPADGTYSRLPWGKDVSHL